ncbi:hypothetical protein F4Z98_18295 [Candidatus Poribacteria bacterium]|nr:hypothetical protein [Candidatus Poribacteria bacterium]MYB59380.1 hypothetical protein [Gemmatimonadota bacterium]
MNERGKLLDSITNTIKDYREGEIAQPTSDHVDRWVYQFDNAVQVPLLREMDYVLKKTYLSKSYVSRFFAKQIENEKLVGDKSREFWQNATILNIQQRGHSQTEIRKLSGQALKRKYGLSIDECGSRGGAFIYLDDALFTGARIGADVSDWIANGPDKATLHIIVIFSHRLGEWQCNVSLSRAVREAGKEIDFRIWAATRLENRRLYRYRSEVLWPTVLPDDDDLKNYVQSETKFPFEPRQPDGRLRKNIFSSENGRQLLEKELLLAGIRIRAFCANPSQALRPLGFGSFNIGFGSTIVTYRNCPNNCPLALWWGDPTKPPYHSLSKWYPLLPRKTHSQDPNFDGTDY